MTFSLLSQYKFSTTDIIVRVSSAIDATFIEQFVLEYKELVGEKTLKGNVFIEDTKTLKFIFTNELTNEDDDFDLLFLSYLAVFKEDFPNVLIIFDFPNFPDTPLTNAFLFKLAHHRVHLLITCKREIFKIYKRGVEFTYEKIVQSVSYIPPIFISADTIDDLFDKRESIDSYKSIIAHLIKKNKSALIVTQHKDDSYLSLQEIYSNIIGKTESWDVSKLSILYFIKSLSELSVLGYFINSQLNIKSTHQIGITFRHSAEDKVSNKLFWDSVLNTLQSNGVFNFSVMECYIFSLVIQNSELFKIPTSVQKMYGQIEKLLNENDRKKAKLFSDKTSDKFLKAKYIEAYSANLRRIINYTKEIAYGLQELAKNIVEHSGAEKGVGYGMITARIYSLAKIKALKNASPEWLKNYEQKHKFMDINIIDTGLTSVIESYKKTIISEMESITKLNTSVAKQLASDYAKDLREMGDYMLNNLFNYDSIKLLHQVNRTKARLGLLIFSQTVLYEKSAFVSLASNSLNSDDSVGFYLYKKDNNIVTITSENYLVLGTNYNFIIPLKEIFEKDLEANNADNKKSSASSSVFKELHPYVDGNKIKNLKVSQTYSELDKYSKIENLRLECCQTIVHGEILLIDASTLKDILQNSSDWVRFLASLQFTAEYIKDIIIVNFDLELYLELINILQIFDRVGIENKGFWSDQRQVLFFLPINNDNGDIFWFNSLLWSADYNKFRRINEDISLYHENLSKLTIKTDSYSPIDYTKIDSLLFSSSKKLLNFELILQDISGSTLFEQTLKSLVKVEINDDINED